MREQSTDANQKGEVIVSRWTSESQSVSTTGYSASGHYEAARPFRSRSHAVKVRVAPNFNASFVHTRRQVAEVRAH